MPELPAFIKQITSKFLRSAIVPFDSDTRLAYGKGFHHKGRPYIHHSDLQLKETAFHRLSLPQIALITTLLIDFIIALFLNWHLTLTIFVSLLTILYFADLLFNLFLIIRNFFKPAEVDATIDQIKAIDESSWPSYSILCPLYKEAHVVPQFVTSMSRLDYSKDKLQVLLLLEEDDKETIQKIRSYDLPSYFEIVIVPHSLPKTKPKACNYGLLKARGEYSVIYDAEDVPDPLQLKKAVLAFAKSDTNTVCVQAKLNFYNPHQNLLTRLFTAEYSLWFDLILTGLQSIQAPIPLGGTSNHFRTADLHKLKGWDSFNVTEDADLGLRLVKQGYKTAIIDSITLEEANSSIPNWFNQRSRWIKGYMQTYLVHMRNPGGFVSGRNILDLLTFQLIIGGKILSMFTNPLMWIITIGYFVLRASIGPFIETFFPVPILYMGVFSLVLGNFLYLYSYVIGCIKHEHDELVKYVFVVPFYWLAMSGAAWVALFELIVAPHHWAKTKHGLHIGSLKTGDELVDTKLTNKILI
jgi:glycosyltransferase XagB